MEEDQNPRTGRTTAIALSLLSRAIDAGGKEIFGKDHFPGKSGMQSLFDATHMLVSKTDLKFSLTLNPRDLSVGVRCVYRF